MSGSTSSATVEGVLAGAEGVGREDDESVGIGEGGMENESRSSKDDARLYV